MFLLDNLKSFREGNGLILKIENRLKYLYTLYIFYFFVIVVILSFFLFIFIQNYLKPKGITLNLPSSNSNFFISSEFKRTIIRITQDNLIYFDRETQPTNIENFLQKVNSNCNKDENCQIFLMFDENVLFGNTINVISYLRDSGYKYVAILTE